MRLRQQLVCPEDGEAVDRKFKASLARRQQRPRGEAVASPRPAAAGRQQVASARSGSRAPRAARSSRRSR
ncbi:MAG TPA: hypothetical protein VEQ10_11645 [Vicinamibacteria bacterium]|nr:hypothetical protein [Vicinamibacteria bacterium]